MGSRRKPVLGVRFSPDGRWLGTLSVDSMSLWDLASSLQSRTFHGDYKGGPNGIVFGQDSDWIAAASAGNAKLWDPRTGDELRSLPVKTGGLISPTAFSADGRLLAAQGAGCCAVKVWDMATGNELQSLPGHIMGITALGFTPEGRLLASGSMEGTVRVWEVASGRELKTLPLNRGLVTALVFSPDGELLATTATADTNVRVWKVATGEELYSLPSVPGNTAVTFSPDGRLLVTYGAANTIKLWEAATGHQLGALSGNTGEATVLAFSPDGHYLVSGTADGAVALWEIATAEQLLSLISTANGSDWLVLAPDGLFDGSPPAWKEILWRPKSDSLDVWPLELFFNEYFYPQLLADVIAGKRPKAITDINQIDRRQPVVTVEAAVAVLPPSGPVLTREFKLRLQVSEAQADKDHPGGGAQDLRLFRNGSLVEVWHGDVLHGKGSTQLEAAVPLVAGENRFSAYAFNHDNVKSSDATLVVTGADSLKRTGTEYIIAAGVNQYANADYNLEFAVADAQDVATELRVQQQRLGKFAKIEVVPLLDEEATKANVLLAVERLAGIQTGPLPPGAPAALAKLRPAQPEDAVFVYFAGHGVALGPRFYLIPHDLGYAGKRTELDQAGLALIQEHSISDLELEQAFEKVDANELVLIIDACNSGQALETEEKRRGPMNSKGLAQLAYEKGMYILTAAQGYQAALEAKELGHGLLTFVLVEEGLKTAAADKEPRDGQVVIREWLGYATDRVPQLQEAKMREAEKSGRELTFVDGENSRGSRRAHGLQRPRVFYRRERELQPPVIARTDLSLQQSSKP